MLQQAINQAADALRPASAEVKMVQIDRLFRFIRTFGLRDFDAQSAAEFYREGLHDIPPDLLEEAVDTMIREYRFTARPPAPGEVRACILTQLQSRFDEMALLEDALHMAEIQRGGRA